MTAGSRAVRTYTAAENALARLVAGYLGIR